MDKEEALIEFLKGLRIAINNSLAYSRQHPYFLKGSRDFKERIDVLFHFLDPIKVNVTPLSLFLDGKDYKKFSFSAELANILHQRKVKSVEFRSGLTVEEVADFLGLLSMQPKEIIKNGGLLRLLNNANTQHIRAEDLDYSLLLGAEGEEAKDAWVSMFKDTVEKQDAQKIKELADNFSKGINNLNLEKVIEDDKLRQDLRGFLGYLKETKDENFAKCSRELSNLVMNSGIQINADNLSKLKEVFTGLDNDDFSDILLSRLSGESALNPLSLGLFSRLAGEERAGKIALGLADKVGAKGGLQDRTVLFKKITALLSGTDAATISPVYRTALADLAKSISPSDALFFDRGQLRVNYRMIILNIFAQEDKEGELDLLLARLSGEWEAIAQEKDYRFLGFLLDTLRQKKEKLPAELFRSVEERITLIIENNIWEEEPSGDLVRLADSLEKCYSPADFYLNKIFQEKKLSVGGLKLFLRFFPSQLNIFYESLREEYSDLEFLSQIIKSLALINLPVALAVLKEIFYSGNELVKVEALKAMQKSPQFDPEFIFPVLKEKSRVLKKAALSVLLRDSASKQRAIGALLGIASPWGVNNQLILENIMIIDELTVSEARDYLGSFSKKRFFWNRQLRNKALEVLEKWK